MSRYRPVGICKICHLEQPLTKEHIPARGSASGRHNRVHVQAGEQIFTDATGRVFQSGFWEYALCEECNRLTGSRYGREFARWSEWGFQFLDARGTPSPRPIPMFRGYPLRIAKQVLSSMLASSQLGLGEKNPHLLDLVRDPERTAGPEDVRLATYLCTTSSGRSTGVAGVLGPTGAVHVLVEFALPPFGYMLTLSGEPHDPRPVDVSWFLTRRYDEECDIALERLVALPTFEPYPGDYRTRDEIRRDVIENTLVSEGHDSAGDEARRIMAAGAAKAFFDARGIPWYEPR